MDAEELPGLTAKAAISSDDFAICAPHNPHFIVAAIDHDEVGLLLVRPEIKVPHRSRESLWPVEIFLHEGSILAEDLHAVIRAVADINQSVIRDLHAMNGIVEGLGNGAGGIIGVAAGIA